jgi:hypothetical protein
MGEHHMTDGGPVPDAKVYTIRVDVELPSLPIAHACMSVAVRLKTDGHPDLGESESDE